MKIGIFGGSFNPPHNTHKKIGLELIEKGYLDKIIYVPTGDKYNKCGLVSAKDRYNMVSLMVKDNPKLEVSDYEIKNKLTFTYETLDYFKDLYKNGTIYFICGSDNLLEINTWRNYQYILDNYNILVIRRNNDSLDAFVGKYKGIIKTDIEMDDLSSTKIRKILKEKDYTSLVDKKVFDYIRKNNLYYA